MHKFHRVILPNFVSIHLKGGPVFSNKIVTTISGREIRICEREKSYQRYILMNCRLGLTEFEILNGFFRSRQGSLYSFLIKDFADFRLSNQLLSNYDENLLAFRIEKTYPDLLSNYQRPIKYIEEGSFHSNIHPLKVDYNKGLVYFAKRPDKVHISTNFYVRVRFASDELSYRIEEDGSFSIERMELFEV